MKASAALVVGDVGTEEAAVRAALEARDGLGELAPDLAVVFVSRHYRREAAYFLRALNEMLGHVPLIGCAAESVIGGGQEVEDAPAVSLWLAAGTGRVETFSVDHLATPGGGLFVGDRFEAGGGPYIVLADPFGFPVPDLLAHLNDNVPQATVIGGLASAGEGPGPSILFLDDEVLGSGAVVAALTGAQVDLLVSQGCRPIGNPYTVTGCEGNVVHGVGGRPPFERLQELVATLPETDRQLLAEGGLQVGQVIDEYRHEQRRGDFLVHSVVGADPSSGAIVVGGDVHLGQTLQFHVRDAASADEDLVETLEQEAAELGGAAARGALIFTCNGRGTRLFERPDHDAALVSKLLGDVPVAGAFCAGELGPVGGRNFLHSYTACVAVFR